MALRSIFCLFFLVSACAGRTTAATQPSPSAFDPGTSDEKAVAVVDPMFGALGGIEAWDKVKQIRWVQKYSFNGELKVWVKHSWDRWNGRHRFENADMATYKESQEQNNPKLLKWSIAMYDLFNHNGRGFASYDGKAVNSDHRDKTVNAGYRRWQLDSYQLFRMYKMKDPGVILTYDGQIDETEGMCKPKCDTIKVTFVPEVGTDTFYVNINTETHMPEVLEELGKQGRIAHSLSDWTEVGGLKFPQRLQNVGLKGEVFEISDISIGSPEDELYIPQVR